MYIALRSDGHTHSLSLSNVWQERKFMNLGIFSSTLNANLTATVVISLATKKEAIALYAQVAQERFFHLLIE